MSAHRPSEARRKPRVRGQKRRLFVTPPEEWEYGARGRPSWIGRGGDWAVVVDRSRIEHVELPQGEPSAQVGPTGLGAPRLEERDPKKLLYAAWLKDCGGDTYLEVARALRFPRGRKLSAAEQTVKRKAIHYVRRGRALACAREIWPWACWPSGIPPRGAWWEDDRCSQWLLIWHFEAIREAARRPAIETALRVRSLNTQQALRLLEFKDGYVKSLTKGFGDD